MISIGRFRQLQLSHKSGFLIKTGTQFNRFVVHHNHIGTITSAQPHRHNHISMTPSSLPATFLSTDSTLSGKQILVTGAASEIGYAVSFACATAGAVVLIMDDRERPLIPLYDKICDHGCKEPMMIAFNLRQSSESNLQQLAGTIAEEFDHLDGLVHGAMWGAPLTPIANSDTTTWLSVFADQFMRPFTLTRSLLPCLDNAEATSIIFTTMDIGRKGRAYWGPVGAAFAATENLVQIWSDESEQGNLRFNTVDPGKVKTGLRQKFYPAESEHGLRPADDQLLMNHYLYLLSDQAAGISGKQFTVPDLPV